MFFEIFSNIRYCPAVSPNKNKGTISKSLLSSAKKIAPIAPDIPNTPIIKLICLFIL
ncbi:hypothetical protein bcgnr5386_53190 [Bacillus cereus]